ncbi:MAG: DUF5678 domain-containing protein [Pirellulales bacterium]
MSDIDIHPAPVIGDVPLVDSAWERNRAYFRQHFPEFLERYVGKFVAVHDGRVVAVGDTFVAAAKAAYAAEGYEPIYIDEVAATPRPMPRVPTPLRVVGKPV